MATSSHQWVLFGIDLKNLWQEYRAAWREVFWQQGAVVRTALDEPVQLVPVDEVSSLLSEDRALAVELPDNLVLERQIRLPRSAQANVSNVIDAEVNASSPFAAEDTVYGWKVLENNSNTLVVGLALCSKSLIMEYLHRADLEPREGLEIWGRLGHEHIVIDGFGEGARHRRYRQRLHRLTILGTIVFVCLLLIFTTPVFYKLQQLEAVQTAYDQVRLEAGEIASLRAKLARRNELVEKLNAQVDDTTHPLLALSALTDLLDDDVWLSAYQQEGRVVEIQGTATNAAAMMQALAGNDIFDRVRATSAFRKLGNQNKERFQIEVTFAERSL